MAAKQKFKRKPAEPKSQREKFVETARKLGTDETGEAFEKVLKAVLPQKTRKR